MDARRTESTGEPLGHLSATGLPQRRHLGDNRRAGQPDDLRPEFPPAIVQAHNVVVLAHARGLPRTHKSRPKPPDTLEPRTPPQVLPARRSGGRPSVRSGTICAPTRRVPADLPHDVPRELSQASASRPPASARVAVRTEGRNHRFGAVRSEVNSGAESARGRRSVVAAAVAALDRSAAASGSRGVAGDRGAAAFAAPGLAAFVDRDCGDDQPGDRVGPAPAEGCVQH